MSSPLRVAFDVTSCAKAHEGGISNYGRGLVRAYAGLGEGDRILLALRPNRWRRWRRVRDLAPGAALVPLCDRSPGLTLGRLDVFHGIGARLPERGDFARVVTIHDVNVFERPELSRPSWRERRRARLRQTAARADLVVVTTGRGAEEIRRHLGLGPERVRVVGEGVDTARFRPPDPEAERGLRRRFGLGERPYLLNLGGFDPRKNQPGLLRAFARADLPQAWRLVLAGPTGEGRERLLRLTRELGLDPDRVRLPGRIAPADLPALFGSSGGYLCASLHEGFGLPVLEAQACGAPVASSDRGGLPETVGDAGLLFDPEDPDAFAAALRRLCDDRSLARRLAARGLERVRRGHDWPTLARRLREVHREASALHRATRGGGGRVSDGA